MGTCVVTIYRCVYYFWQDIDKCRPKSQASAKIIKCHLLYSKIPLRQYLDIV